MRDLGFVGWGFIHQFTYYQRIHLHSCYVTMCVSFRSFDIVFEGITSIEEFTNVSTNVHINQELPTRMIRHILTNIKNKIIEYHQFPSLLNLLIEFFNSPSFLCFLKCSLASSDQLIQYFDYDE